MKLLGNGRNIPLELLEAHRPLILSYPQMWYRLLVDGSKDCVTLGKVRDQAKQRSVASALLQSSYWNLIVTTALKV